MNEYLVSLNAVFEQVRANVPIVLAIIGILILIHILNASLGYRLNIFGIIPRHPFGLIGIATSPFLHVNFNHLFFNSIPLFILSSLVLLEGMQMFLLVSLLVIVLGGLLTWIFGRRSIHVGASGLIMGYWSYLLANAWNKETLISIVLAGVCVYYFGGFFLEIVPGRKGVSWEGHLFGAIAGVLVAVSLPFLIGMYD